MSPENHRNVISAASFFSNGLTSQKPLISSIRYCIGIVDKEIWSLENNTVVHPMSHTGDIKGL